MNPGRSGNGAVPLPLVGRGNGWGQKRGQLIAGKNLYASGLLRAGGTKAAFATPRSGADMDAIDILFTASFWVAAIRIAAPLIFATMGELVCERAGVLNLGIEGIM